MLDGPDKDEIDGYDETIVPHDSRTDDIFDLSDDELNGLLRQITDKAKAVTFIFDSCHSGAALRAGKTVRNVKDDHRLPPPPSDFAFSKRGSDFDSGIGSREASYVLISACLPTQLANESTFGPMQQRHGALTWFLAEALRTSLPSSTYRSVIEKVAADVNTKIFGAESSDRGLGPRSDYLWC